MFDIGFLELIFVALIALLVMGPERLPDAIQKTALWIARIKRMFNQMKTDIKNEIDTDAIKQQLHNESIMQSIEEAKSNMQDVSDSLRQHSEKMEYDINGIVREAKNNFQKTDDNLQQNLKHQEDNITNPVTETKQAPSEPDQSSSKHD